MAIILLSVFLQEKQHENPIGKLIWVRSPQSATSQATSDQSNLNDTSGKMLQEPQTELTAQTINNIKPLQMDVKSETEKNQEKNIFLSLRCELALPLSLSLLCSA